MHELAVTESLLEIALRHGREAGAERITDLYLVIGQLSSIVDESVQFYWDLISEGSAAAGARLHFRRIPTELLCLECGTRYSPEGDELACPACGSIRVQILAGEEFSLEAIDIEPGEAPPADEGRSTDASPGTKQG
jgi:hydrogenase nickel incorporation protein HypA/HybF